MTRAGALLGAMLMLAGCSPTPSDAPLSATGPAGTSLPVAAASPAPTTSAIDLPNPGGTCDASTFAPASVPAASFVSAALGTRHLVIKAVFRHAGPTCTLAHPSTIALGSSPASLVLRDVPNLGTPACIDNDCVTVYPTDYAAYRYSLTVITFNAWWWNDPNPLGLPSPRPCTDPLADVSHTEIPLAVGHLAFSWDTAVKTVCASPATFSMGIDVVGDTGGPSPPPSSAASALPCEQGQVTLTRGPTGAGAGTAYLAVFADLVAGAPCTLARGPAISIVDATGKPFSTGTRVDATPLTIAGQTAFLIGWNVACEPRATPTSALSARIEFSRRWTAVLPIGDFGPSCVDGSTGELFVEPAAS